MTGCLSITEAQNKLRIAERKNKILRAIKKLETGNQNLSPQEGKVFTVTAGQLQELVEKLLLIFDEELTLIKEEKNHAIIN